jgi:putative transposase
MTNHVHLLVTPQKPGAVSKMMQAIGRRYVGCFNARYRRTGTLWEGRFKAALVDSDRYLLTCYRYIELKPVRAGMALVPMHYRWLSHRSNAGGAEEAPITPHPYYLALGASPADRQETCRALSEHPVSSADPEAFRSHTSQQRALGSERFRAQVGSTNPAGRKHQAKRPTACWG